MCLSVGGLTTVLYVFQIFYSPLIYHATLSIPLLPYTYYTRNLIRADDYSPYAKIDTYTVLIYLRSVANREKEF
jgi:hypothetical protein